MDCAGYRQAILADPHDDRANLREHLIRCRDCTQYTDQVLKFEGRLERAFRVAMDPPRARAGGPRQSPRGWQTARHWRAGRGWLAAAASVLLAVVVAGGLWLAAPQPSLAAAVVGHMAEEPRAWARTDVPVPRGVLDQVLGESHVRLKGGAGLVSYANSCLFRGHHVPHLVVQTDSGPVTVMVLPHESAWSSTRFDEDGYRGIIVPVPGHGSIAVLERGPATGMAEVQDVASKVLAALDWY